VTLGKKSVPLAQFILQALNIRIHDFDILPAGGTDQVVMVLVAVQMFVAGGAILKVQLPAQTALAKMFHGPVYRGQAHQPVPAVHRPVNILHRNVAFRRQEYPQDQFPRPGLAEPQGMQIFPEYGFLGGLFHVLNNNDNQSQYRKYPAPGQGNKVQGFVNTQFLEVEKKRASH
jgi:hypothetical protein